MAATTAGAGAPVLFQPTVRDHVPAIRAEERPACEAWLHSIGFLGPGRDGDEWEAIKKNWVGFLKATRPPARAAGRAAGGRDHRDRRAIQMAFWEGADGLEGLAERWPAVARRVLTQAAEGPHAAPFESLGAKWLLEGRRRFQSVWTGLVCFLTYSQRQGTLGQMGLLLDKTQLKDLLKLHEELAAASAEGNTDSVFDSVVAFILGSVTDNRATAHKNAILWWTAVLVRSAISGDDEADDFISRGAFTANILPIDIPLRDRVASMLHVSRTLLLQRAFYAWEGKPRWVMEIQKDLNAVDITWLDNDSGPRPNDYQDRRMCTSPAWLAMLAHLRSEAEMALGGTLGTPMFEVARLAALLREVPNRTDVHGVASQAPGQAEKQEQGHLADPHREVQAMLGGRTVAEFAGLEAKQRATMLRRHLVQPKPVIISEGDLVDGSMYRLLNPHTATGALLRQQRFVGTDEAGRRMVAEAQEAYYGGNTFEVPLDCLRDFLWDFAEDEEKETFIGPLLRKGIIVDLEEAWERQPELGSTAAWVEEELRTLQLITQPLRITLRLAPSQGQQIDLRTKLQLIDIATVVTTLLVDDVGHRIDVVQDVLHPPPTTQRSLLLYLLDLKHRLDEA